MPRIEDLIARATADRVAAERVVSDRGATLTRMLAAAGGAENLPADQSATADRLIAERRAAQDTIKAADASLATLREVQADNAHVATLQRVSTPTGTRMPTRVDRVCSVSIGREARTYRADEDPHGERFINDICASAMFRDPLATERLARHAREETVERPGMSQRAAGDATTGALVGMVVPQYLTTLYAPAIAAMRPLADLATHHSLPDQGMTVNIPRVTTATSAALQATELTGVSATSIADTLLTLNVQTAAGQQNVSRQAVERGVNTDTMVLADLMRRVATVIDNTLINQAATGITNTAQVTTYTDATPTAPELWPFLTAAQSLLEQAILGVALPSHAICHPRRWNWLTSQVGSTWPFIGAPGVAAQQGGIILNQSFGQDSSSPINMVRGFLNNGLKVVCDGNVPTNLGVGVNQDEIYVIAQDEIHLWEPDAGTTFIRAEQPNAPELGILIVCYQYFAATAQRYSNNPGKISGTGLTAPAGF